MSDTAAAHEAPTSTGIDHKKLIMWLFLASDCMFFGTLISTHLLYRKLFPAGFTDAEGHQRFIQDLFSIELTSFSTFILLMSSFLMALAVSAMHKGQLKSFRRNVLGVIIFGLIFLGCQVFEFTHFYHKGLTIQNSVLGSTFYVLTGTHGTHETKTKTKRSRSPGYGGRTSRTNSPKPPINFLIYIMYLLF